MTQDKRRIYIIPTNDTQRERGREVVIGKG